MRKLLLSLLILLPALNVSAREINAIVLHLASGNNVTCLLELEPVVTFSGEDLVIKTSMSTITYKSTDVNKFTYQYVDPSAVNSVKAEGTLFSLNGNVLNANSLAPNSTVSVFTVDGKKVAETKASANGSVALSLPSQSGMTYIVNTSVANFKITMP